MKGAQVTGCIKLSVLLFGGPWASKPNSTLIMTPLMSQAKAFKSCSLVLISTAIGKFYLLMDLHVGHKVWDPFDEG